MINNICLSMLRNLWLVGQVRADEEADIETMKAEIAAEEARIAELQDKIAKTTRSKLDLQVTSIPSLPPE